MTRGASAATLLPVLEGLTRRAQRTRPWFVHEMHNLQIPAPGGEKLAGRTLHPSEVERSGMCRATR